MRRLRKNGWALPSLFSDRRAFQMLSSLYFDSLRLETRLQLEELMKLICLR